MENRQIEKIKRVRQIVLESQEFQDKLYSDLIQELGLQKHTLDEEFLFDAVFNSEKESDFEYFIGHFDSKLKERE